VADDDFLRVDGTAIEGRSASEVLSDIGALPLAGGSLTGAVTIAVDSNADTLVLKSTDDDAVVGPILVLQRDSSSPADNDALGFINFTGDDDTGTQTAFATMAVTALDVSNGAMDGKFELSTIVANGLRSRMLMNDTETVFNDGSIDLDFRVESDAKTAAFFVEGGGGTDGFIGLNTSTPQKMLHLVKNDSDGIMIFDADGTTTDHQIVFAKDYGTGGQSGGKYFGFGVDRSENQLVIAYDENSQPSLASDKKFVFTNSGRMGINRTPSSHLEIDTIDTSSIIETHSFDANAQNHMQFRNHNDSEVGSITVTTSGTSYNESSDHRLKENVADMTGCIDRVKALAPKRFNFIIDPDRTVDGFLAHEVQAVVPEAITGTHNEVKTWTQKEIDDGDAPDGTSAGDNKLDKDGKAIPVYQGIDKSKLVPLLAGALQEAIAKIETLETKVAALQAE